MFFSGKLFDFSFFMCKMGLIFFFFRVFVKNKGGDECERVGNLLIVLKRRC